MDEEHILILVKSKDRTKDILIYDMRDQYVHIVYTSNPQQEYRYPQADITIYQNPQMKDIAQNERVYFNDIPLYQVVRIYDFGPKIRVINNRGKDHVYDAESIRVVQHALSTNESNMIFEYYMAISRHSYITGENRGKAPFLHTQFKKLTFVNPNSVLAHFLNRQQIKKHSCGSIKAIFPFKFNLSQKMALENAIYNQISVIQGPPGTGKTQTILNILANLVVMRNKTVAVVAGNNAAVQNVRDKLKAEKYDFLVASLGSSDNKNQFFTDLPVPNVSSWKGETDEKTLLNQIQAINDSLNRLMEIERLRAQLRQDLAALHLEQEHFESFYQKQDINQIGRLSFYRQTPESIISFLIDNHIALENETANSLFHKIKLVINHGFIGFKRMKRQKTDVLLSFQRKYYELKISEISNDIARLDQEIEQNSYSALLEQHQQYSTELFRHKLFSKYNSCKPFTVQPATYKKHFDKFIEQFPIVLSTTHSLRTCVPDDYLFDYVIVDESSQVDLLTGTLALSCCKNVIIVGDTKQLPQITDKSILSKPEVAERHIEGGAYDYFAHNLLSSVLALYDQDVPQVMLREHYRCHPKIIEFCNRKYYGGELIAFTQAKEGEFPLVIYSTAAGNHMRELTHGTKGKFNQRELDVTQQEVLAALEDKVESYSDVGFTTPYRAQLEKANEQLRSDIEADTVHKYQGREKRVMILSTVLDRTRSGKAGLTFVSDPRLVNVAVSRAQRQLILVTDRSAFRKYGNEIGDLIRYMEYSTVDDNLVQSEIVSVFDLLYRDYSEKLREFGQKIKQISKFKSENLVWTLLSEILPKSYPDLECRYQLLIKNIFAKLDSLQEEERKYVHNGASVDFVLYHKLDRSPVLAIEVDGFAFHANNPRQLERDAMKDRIFHTFGLPLLRLPTTGSGEEQLIRKMLDQILQS
jgi:Superfamily I DNA and RNA helicases and helicase subunits